MPGAGCRQNLHLRVRHLSWWLTCHGAGAPRSTRMAAAQTRLGVPRQFTPVLEPGPRWTMCEPTIASRRAAKADCTRCLPIDRAGGRTGGRSVGRPIHVPEGAVGETVQRLLGSTGSDRDAPSLARLRQGATSAGMKLEVQPATPFAWLESQVPAVATGIVAGFRRF